MEYRYASSKNAKYFVVWSDTAVFLMNSDVRAWGYTLERGTINSVQVVDDSTVVVDTTEDDFFIFEPDSNGVPRKLAIPRDVFLLPASSGNRVLLSHDGKLVVYMKKVVKAQSKFLASLQGDKKSKNQSEYELILLEHASLRINSIYKISVPESLDEFISWDFSDDFAYYLVTSPKKSGSKVKIEAILYDAVLAKPVRTLKLVDTVVKETSLNRNGALFFHLKQGDVQSYMVMTREGQISNFPYDPNTSFHHLSRGFVLFEKRISDESLVYIAQSFSGQYLTSVNMNPFLENGVEPGILFDSKDLINLVYMHNNRFHRYPSELLTLSTEVKRFEMMLLKKDQPVSSNDDFDYYTEYFGYDEPHNIEISEQSYKQRELEVLQSLSDKPSPSEISDDSDTQKKSRTVSIDFPPLSFKKNARPLAIESVEPEIPLPPDIKPKKKISLDIHLKKKSESFPQQSSDEKKTPAEAAKESLPDINVSAELSGSSRLFDITSEEAKEIKKLERLLNSIEDRFMMGEINEQSYHDLKQKYLKQLQNRQNKL